MVYSNSANIDVWGAFLDNHDNPRYLNQFIGNSNYKYRISLLHNALTWLMLHRGIPIVYYATEQQYDAGPYNQWSLSEGDPHKSDAAYREPLWYSKYNQSKDTFRLLARLNMARNAAQASSLRCEAW